MFDTDASVTKRIKENCKIRLTSRLLTNGSHGWFNCCNIVCLLIWVSLKETGSQILSKFGKFK